MAETPAREFVTPRTEWLTLRFVDDAALTLRVHRGAALPVLAGPMGGQLRVGFRSHHALVSVEEVEFLPAPNAPILVQPPPFEHPPSADGVAEETGRAAACRPEPSPSLSFAASRSPLAWRALRVPAALIAGGVMIALLPLFLHQSRSHPPLARDADSHASDGVTQTSGFAAQPVQRVPSAPQPVTTPASQVYTVQTGDTLEGIARRELGDASRWREISALNQDTIKGANLIGIGQVLIMPSPVPGPSLAAPSARPDPSMVVVCGSATECGDGSVGSSRAEVAACLRVTAMDGDQPLLLVVTGGEEPPLRTDSPAVIARSAPITQSAVSTCHPVRALAGQLAPGSYTLWVFAGSLTLDTTKFQVRSGP